jgi:hypothetical protein
MILPTVARCALLLAMTALVASCGSPPQTSDTTGIERYTASNPVKSDATARPTPATRASLCTMLPKADMEAILGGPLTNADGADTAGKTQCTYVGFGRFADVAIEWGNGEAGMAGARLAAKFMGATAGPVQVMTPIADLGDEAMLMIGGVLNVRKGDDLITVDLRTQKNPELLGPTIARKVIEKM